jgi:hypothetical protein
VRRPSFLRARPICSLLLAALTAVGCATSGTRAIQSYRFFETPDAGDAWAPQISRWQARERAVADTELLRPEPTAMQSAVSGPAGRTIEPAAAQATTRSAPVDDLRSTYFAFRSERKRALATAVADWVQREARRHYIPDGPVDHWATLEETLARNGDDCDGLELLTYHALLDLGFRDAEVYRAIVNRPEDGQHHMVTLWFEDPEDPWVIDPTGAMTSGMPRLSQVPGWVPLKLFTEHMQYTVRTNGPTRAHPALAR